MQHASDINLKDEGHPPTDFNKLQMKMQIYMILVQKSVQRVLC